MELKELRWVGICTPNLDQAVDYYKGVLGMSVRNRGFIPGEPVDCEYVEMIMPNGDMLELFDHNLPERELFDRPVFGFEVDDVASAREEMMSRGVKFLRPTAQGSDIEWAYFQAPDGNVCQIMGSRHK